MNIGVEFRYNGRMVGKQSTPKIHRWPYMQEADNYFWMRTTSLVTIVPAPYTKLESQPEWPSLYCICMLLEASYLKSVEKMVWCFHDMAQMMTNGLNFMTWHGQVD